MTQEQLILFKRSLNIYNTEIEAWTALDNLIHTQGQPVVAFFRRTSNTHGDTALGAIFAIGTDNGVGKYKACSSHDDMFAVAQALNTHISEWTAFKDTFDKMFEYDANHKAIKAKLDFYTDSNKNISAGGLGGSGSSSLGALYQLVDVMINSTGDGVEGAVEGSVLAYDATAGKWKAIAQSEILPDMSGYYTKEETDAAINAIPIYSIAKLSASDIAGLSDGTNVREAYRLKKGGSNVDDTVIKIYKDSAIKSLELRDNKYLVLTYTNNEGNEQSISKDLSVIINDNYVDLINNQEIGGIKTFTEKTLFKKDINVLGDAVVGGEVAAIVSDGTPAGVTDYSALTGKPSINGKELASGNNTLDELGIQPKGDYTTASQLATTLENYATKVFVSNNYATKAAVNTIQALIPATASADNQLADKAFVNSSIATATAEFKGSFTSLDELKATSGNLNDYAFYLHTDSVGNKVVDRYKWTTAGWLYEYTLNNSSFTAEQWAALNSAITATLVQSYNSHLKNSTIHITSDERTKWNNKWDYNEATIKAVKVNAAGSADYASSAGDADTLDGVHYQNILERTHSGASLSGTATGWFRIAESLATDAMAITFLLAIKRDYYTTPNESYLFSISISYRGGISITQLSGYANYRLITKIRVDWAGSKIAYVDLYINTSVNQSTYYWYTIGCAKSYTAWTANPTLVGTAYEFTTVNGCKSDRGFTGDLVGNSSSATKLQDNTAFTVWGQKFFENGKPKNVSGDLTNVGNITASGKATIQGDIVCGGEVVAIAGEGTPAGVTDYSALTGKPQINGVTLVSGNNTLAALGIQAAGDYATNSGVTTLLADYATKVFVSNNYAGKAAFNAHIADNNIHITSAERAAWDSKWDYDEATIKAVKVTSASSADSVAWAGISGKPTTFTPSAHTHTASDVSGLPTSLKNPYKLTFGSKTYDGSAAATITASDLGALTSITKSMVEGVLTGDITSHTHTFASLTSKPTTIAGYGITDAYTATTIDSKLSGYLPLSGGTMTGSIKFNDNSLPSKTLSYVCGIDAFANGGEMGWMRGSDFVAQYAPTLTGTGASGTWGISITGNAATATNADTLDGVHYQNILERTHSGASLSGTATGWFRIAESLATDAMAITFLLAIKRDYYTTPNESYLFSISISYRGGISITQLSGYANYRLITKIRVDWAGSKIAYVDLYINTSVNQSTYYWYTIGCAKSYTAWTANPTLVGTAYEFTTVNGCKSDRGFTGDLVGNASSATKLATARTLWGQSFDGMGDIWGDLNMRYNKITFGGSANDYHIGWGDGNMLVYKNYFGHYFVTNNTERMRITIGGNVLIGTTTDNGYKLQVNGSERVYGDLIVDGEVSALVA